MSDTIVLGLSLGHDASATVVKNGKIISHVLRERHSGYRHHYGIDQQTIELALKESSCLLEDINYCAITVTQELPALIENKDFFTFKEKLDNDNKSIQVHIDCQKTRQHSPHRQKFHHDFRIKTEKLITGTFTNKDKKVDIVQNFFNGWEEIRKLPKDIGNDWELIFYTPPIYGPLSWKDAMKMDELPIRIKQFINDGALDACLYREIRVLINGKRLPGFFISHHLAHASSSYYSSPFEKSLIFTHDGGGGIESGFVFVGQNNFIFPVGPHYLECGRFYEYSANRCGFEIMGSPGKLMGLSSYGKGYLNNILPIGTLLDWQNWGENYTNKNANHIYEVMINNLLINAEEKGIDVSSFGKQEAILTDITTEIAHAVQKQIEKTVSCTVDICKGSLESCGLDVPNLCLSGGVALNCPTNSTIWNKNIFEDIHIEPHCEDGGLSIGAAQFVFFHVLGSERKKADENIGLSSQYAMQGINHSHDEISCALKEYDSNLTIEKIENWHLRAAEDIANNLVIAVYQGKSETGPRALGNRSILAHPGYQENWERVNVIKGREKWRPFAPVILEDQLYEWFESGPPRSPFMLFTYIVKGTKKHLIPAVTHVDQTSRVQTVNKEDENIYLILQYLNEIAGIPIIMNTSFNGPGQPIVEYPSSAIEMLLNTNLSTIYIENYRIERK